MTLFNRSLFLATLLSITVAYGPACYAEPGKGRGHGKEKHQQYSDDGDHHGKSKGKGKHKHKDKGRGDGGYHVSLSDGDRITIRGLLAERYRPNCPPGLAKKRNGCLPPGIAKKRYRVGYPLESGLEFEYLPDAWLSRLGPVPVGYQYVMVDKDVLLISEASHKVIDAITLLSAVGQ